MLARETGYASIGVPQTECRSVVQAATGLAESGREADAARHRLRPSASMDGKRSVVQDRVR